MRNEACKCVHVPLAILEDIAALSCGERRALYDPIAHVRLMRGVDPVLTEVLQRAGEAVEALFAVAALDGAVVHVVAKLDIGIERASWLSPTLCDVAAELGADGVADDQRVSIEPVRRERAELVLPQANDPARSHLECNEAERCCFVARPAAVR
jgi:hypothetical protein